MLKWFFVQSTILSNFWPILDVFDQLLIAAKRLLEILLAFSCFFFTELNFIEELLFLRIEEEYWWTVFLSIFSLGQTAELTQEQREESGFLANLHFWERVKKVGVKKFL